MRILHFIDGTAPSLWYRAGVPAMELERRGHEVAVEREVGPAHIARAQVVVFHGPREPGTLSAVHSANAAGKLTVCDFNEDIWHLHPANPRSGEWYGQDLGIVEAVLRSCDVVTTATRHMERLLLPLNPNTVLMPDMLPDDLWPLAQKSPSDVTVVGWADSSPTPADVALLTELLGQLAPRLPEMDFAVFGPPGVPIATTVSDEDLHLRSRMRFIPMAGGPDVPPQTLAQFDVGLAPVGTPALDRALPDLQILEYAGAGVPCIASKVDAFEGTPALFARNTKDWLRLIRRLVTDVPFRLQAGADALRWAKGRVASRSAWDELFECAMRDLDKEPAR